MTVSTDTPDPPALPLDADGVDSFVHRLRGDFAEIYPANWKIDWRDVPSPFRWYETPRRIDLPAVPRALLRGGAEEGAELARCGLLERLGALLHGSYGVTGVRWYPDGIAKSSPEEPAPVHRNPHYQLRRPVPSGGVTFPAECYLTVGGDASLPGGVYHYDATRHALVPLADGRAPVGVGRPDGGLRIVLTLPLWKNHFKYGDFSYRLAAMDLGAVVGQFDLTARRWGWSARVSFGNDERLLLDQLGLDAEVEAAPAVLDIGPPGHRPDTHVALVGALAWRGAVGPPGPDSGARRMHCACLQAAQPGRVIDLPPVEVPDASALPHVALPEVQHMPVGVADAWVRTALGEQLRDEPIDPTDLAGWMGQVHQPLDSDVPMEGSGPEHPRCMLLIRSVTGVPQGAYLPMPDGRLVRLADGEFGSVVQCSLFGSYMNVGQAPLVAVVVGAADPQRGSSGPIGYRTQHLLAGLLAQRLSVVAARDGFSAHPVLGFVSRDLDGPLGLADRGLTALLLLAIGRYRSAPYLESSLHPTARTARDAS